MSKGKKAKYDMTPYNEYKQYLQSYDTSNVDNTLSNLTNWAANSSANNLYNMGDYTFNIDGSDDARQRAEEATYNSYVDKLQPQFDRERENMATMLQNQGIPIGSEAYSRAMTDLEDKQNEALQQAAYTSVLNGQNAFSQSLADEMNAGSYGINAQQAYINQLLGALNGSASGYENQQNIFSVGTGKSQLQYAQDKANSKSGLTGALTGAVQGGLAGFASGGPWGALAGAAAGAYGGYNKNPYSSGR
jgi:hypothetical protein